MTSVTKRVIAVSLLAQVILYGVLAVGAVYHQHQRESVKLQQRAAALIDAVAVMAVEPVWNFDYGVLERIMAALCEDPALSSCLITLRQGADAEAPSVVLGWHNNAGAVMARGSAETLLSAALLYEPHLLHERAIYWENIETGQVSLHFNRAQLQQDLRSWSFNLLIILILLLVVTMLVTAAVLRRFFVLPMSRLHQAMDTVTGELQRFQRQPASSGSRLKTELPSPAALFERSGIDPQRGDEFGTFVRAFGVLLSRYTDLATQLAAHSDELACLNEELEGRVAERTQELETSLASLKAAQAQLIQQEKLASIGQLAAGVAHEINNPLGFISSNINRLGEYLKAYETTYQFLLKEIQGLPEPQCSQFQARLKRLDEELDIDFIRDDYPHVLAECLEGSVRVRDIVQNLKDFSRPNQGGHEELFMDRVLSNAVAWVERELEHECTLTYRYSGQARILGNYGELCQAAFNVLMNAIQAVRSQGRSGVVAVNVTETDTDVGFTIADNGCGMDSATQTRIYDPFFTTRPVGEGAGLGMHLVYDIVVNRHHGRIDLDSELEAGSRVTVWLPRVTDEVPMVAVTSKARDEGMSNDDGTA